MNAEIIRPDLQDLNVIVSGQGGDGSLTVVTLLASVLRQNGMSVYTERDVLSRIRGGHAAAITSTCWWRSILPRSPRTCGS